MQVDCIQKRGVIGRNADKSTGKTVILSCDKTDVKMKKVAFPVKSVYNLFNVLFVIL